MATKLQWSKCINEAKSQLILAWPISLGLFVNESISLVSLIFVGHLGEHELAYASLASTISKVFGFSILVALSYTLRTLCSQAHGAKDFEALGLSLQQGVVINLFFCIPITLLWINTKEVLLACGMDGDIAYASSRYLIRLLPGLWSDAVCRCIRGWLDSQGITRPYAVVMAIAAIFHILINVLFVNMLGWGAMGASLAVSVNYLLQLAMLLTYVHYSNLLTHTQFTLSWRAFRNWGFYLYLAIPNVVMISEWWASEISILLAGSAAYPHPDRSVSQIALFSTTNQIGFMISLGLMVATNTRVGNAVGRATTEGIGIGGGSRGQSKGARAEAKTNAQARAQARTEAQLRAAPTKAQKLSTVDVETDLEIASTSSGGHGSTGGSRCDNRDEDKDHREEKEETVKLNGKEAEEANEEKKKEKSEEDGDYEEMVEEDSSRALARVATIVGPALALALTTAECLALHLLAPVWPRMFTTNRSLIANMAPFVRLSGLYIVFDGLAAVLGGVLNGTGRQSRGAPVVFVAYYLIGLPVSLYFGLGLGKGGKRGNGSGGGILSWSWLHPSHALASSSSSSSSSSTTPTPNGTTVAATASATATAIATAIGAAYGNTSSHGNGSIFDYNGESVDYNGRSSYTTSSTVLNGNRSSGSESPTSNASSSSSTSSSPSSSTMGLAWGTTVGTIAHAVGFLLVVYLAPRWDDIVTTASRRLSSMKHDGNSYSSNNLHDDNIIDDSDNGNSYNGRGNGNNNSRKQGSVAGGSRCGGSGSGRGGSGGVVVLGVKGNSNSNNKSNSNNSNIITVSSRAKNGTKYNQLPTGNNDIYAQGCPSANEGSNR